MPTTTAASVEPLIGLEIHVQLATRTKLWCGCAVAFAAPPNSSICPVCLGLPGALPVLNARAVELATRVSLALDCQIARTSCWDRKHYFYPDQPRNYQISQYARPLGHGGRFEWKSGRGAHCVRIRRTHLEDDAGKNAHAAAGTTIDLNRAGAPLLEIVTEPDLHSADEARDFAVALRRLIRYLEASPADMQQGQMRFEPNINLRIRDADQEFTAPIVEVKNLNSFRSLHGAIRFEIDRQRREWQKSGLSAVAGKKTNRGWDDDRQVTTPQRVKEEAHDYRYFPDPDLPPLDLDQSRIEEVRRRLPEPLAQRAARIAVEFALSPAAARAILDCRATADLLDQAAAAGGDRPELGKHFLGIWAQHANNQSTTVAGLGVPARCLAQLANLVRNGNISASSAARVADEIIRRVRHASAEALIAHDAPADAANLDPLRLAQKHGLLQVSDAAKIDGWVAQALAENGRAVQDALAGAKKRAAARGFLAGRAMKLSGGQANPTALRESIDRQLAQRQDH